MTLKQLQDRIKIRRGNGYCSYIVTITYRGTEYSTRSNNSLAWDRISDADEDPRTEVGFYTLKQAYLAFYDECKRDNGL